MYQSWMDRRSRSERPWPSTVYQKTCPTPVASGPSVGTTPVGRDFDSRLSRSSTRVRAKYRSTESSKITLIIEKPKAEEDRTTLTPGSPWRLTVSGYVIWSSTSWGERPGQSVKTMTWLSDRSGMASIGVDSRAQYPHPATRMKQAMTRNRLRIETPISQLITGPYLRTPPEPPDDDPDEHDKAREQRSEEHTSELQSQFHLVCRLLLEKKKINRFRHTSTTTNLHPCLP